jgi:hypothetical protein
MCHATSQNPPESLESETVNLFSLPGRAEGFAMQPKERRGTGEQDLFRSRLDQTIDLQHELVRLAPAIDWPFREEKFGAVYTDKPVCPMRLVVAVIASCVRRHPIRRRRLSIPQASAQTGNAGTVRREADPQDGWAAIRRRCR